MKKSVLCILLSVALMVGLLTGCSSVSPVGDDGKISVVTTIFPEYDWVRRIVGESDGVDLTMLLDNGVDLHSYQPTADDIIKISTCDLFVYVGGESDEWVDDALSEATNKDMVVLDLLDVLGDAVKEEEIVEGMEGGEDEDELECDEHVWLSLKNAATLCRVISEKLCEIDPENRDVYTANTDAYVGELNELDAAYKAAVDAGRKKTVLFADRYPFRYLTDDYGLDYYAAFAGCSAETEASFKTVSFLAAKVDELGLSTVLTLEGSDRRIAQTVLSTAKTKNVQIAAVDSMQSTTSSDVKKGATYLSIMEQNLESLKIALQ